MTYSIRMLATAVGIFYVTPSVAQSAEVNATYALTGVADDARLELEGGEARWRRVEDSPARFLAEASGGDKHIVFSLTTRKVDACRYEITGVATISSSSRVATPTTELLEIVADLRRIQYLEVVDGKISAGGEGLCVRDRMSAECHQDLSGIATGVDPSRHRRAVMTLGLELCRR